MNSAAIDWGLVRGVSRTFYFSLRFLPSGMREPVAMAYLLARLSDTVADEGDWTTGERLSALTSLPDAWEAPELSRGPTRPQERLLLESAPSLLQQARGLSDHALIFGVWATILEGQRFDLNAFPAGTAERRPLADEELERYLYLVAGCVGEFWTALAERHLSGAWSKLPFEEMKSLGVSYGKGLQLLNILRDAPKDQAAGRSYFEPTERPALLQRCAAYLEAGERYIGAIRHRQLRLASALPCDLARPTLGELKTHPGERVKISRTQLALILLRRLLMG